jgi:hypothetical protein
VVRCHDVILLRNSASEICPCLLLLLHFCTCVQGLGKKEDGSATHLRAVRRAEETLGIGANTDAFGSNCWDQRKHNFSQVLDKLKENHSSSIISLQNNKNVSSDACNTSSKKRKKEPYSTVSPTEQLILAQNRVTSGHAAKVRKSKDIATKSDEEMAAIFGMSVEEFKKSHDVTKADVGYKRDGQCKSPENDKKKSKKRKKDLNLQVTNEENNDRRDQVFISSAEKCGSKAYKKKTKKSRGEDHLIAVCS